MLTSLLWLWTISEGIIDFLNSSRDASVHLLSKSVFITLVKDCLFAGWVGGCWAAVIDLLHLVFCSPHCGDDASCPTLVTGLLTTFLLFFLPDLW